MVRVPLLFATALAVTASGARAADLPVHGPYTKAPVAAVTMSWTGPYVGLSLGGRWAETDWTTSATSNLAGVIVPGQVSADSVTGFDSSAVRVGGYAGTNWQIAPGWLVGVEGDFGWARNDRSNGGIPGTGVLGATAGRFVTDQSSVKLGWDASLRARAGYLVLPAWLLYGTGGVAFQDVEVGAACDGSVPSWCLAPRAQAVSNVLAGWTVGGGLEWMVTPQWLLRGEYRYADFGRTDNTLFAGTLDAVVTSVAVRTHTVSGGVAFKW